MNPSNLEGRRCLGVLQQNKEKQSVLMVNNGKAQILSNKGRKRKSNENSVPTKMRRLDGIYEDPKPIPMKQTSLTSVGIQTDSSSCKAHSETEVASEPSCSTQDDKNEKVLRMLTCEVAPPEYWEELAEKRREALEETLIENKQLHEENKMLRAEISELKEENKLLNEMVSEAKELAQLVQTLTSDEEAK